MTNHTIICAIATPPGRGAIAIIRISGEGCIALCEGIFVSPSGKKLSHLSPNSIVFGKITDGKEIVDEVLLSVFHAPHSFTGEESVEISCHGSTYIQQRMLQLLIAHGACLAHPGEFTQRAFLNGKMDLSQAEAVADLIASTSSASHKMAISQMRGGFSVELRKLRQELLHLTSLLELELDFSEEDVEFADREQLLSIAREVESLITKLADSFSLGNAIKNGVPVAIAGNTNVGKSTLLNALLREERAIVSDIEGTTRDVIEDTINLNGILFRFIDTAGIRETKDVIETMGIERTFAKISQASIVLLMTDPLKEISHFSSYYRDICQHLSGDARLIILINKADTVDSVDSYREQVREQISGEPILALSAKTGEHLDILIHLLTEEIQATDLTSSDVIVSNVRHYEALSLAKKSIQRAIEGLNTNLSGEFVSQDIRETLHYLGEITGEITTDEVLGNIFRHFCIGK